MGGNATWNIMCVKYFASLFASVTQPSWYKSVMLLLKISFSLQVSPTFSEIAGGNSLTVLRKNGAQDYHTSLWTLLP